MKEPQSGPVTSHFSRCVTDLAGTAPLYGRPSPDDTGMRWEQPQASRTDSETRVSTFYILNVSYVLFSVWMRDTVEMSVPSHRWLRAQQGIADRLALLALSTAIAPVFGVKCRESWKIVRGRSEPFYNYVVNLSHSKSQTQFAIVLNDIR